MMKKNRNKVELLEMIDMRNAKTNFNSDENKNYEMLSKSSQTSSPIINEINSIREKIELNNNEISIFPSKFKRGEEYVEMKSEHIYLNDSITVPNNKIKMKTASSKGSTRITI